MTVIDEEYIKDIETKKMRNLKEEFFEDLFTEEDDLRSYSPMMIDLYWDWKEWIGWKYGVVVECQIDFLKNEAGWFIRRGIPEEFYHGLRTGMINYKFKKIEIMPLFKIEDVMLLQVMTYATLKLPEMISSMDLKWWEKNRDAYYPPSRLDKIDIYRLKELFGP